MDSFLFQMRRGDQCNSRFIVHDLQFAKLISFLQSKDGAWFYGKEVRELATLVELENRVKKLEERSSVQGETMKRMLDFIEQVIDEKSKKLEERSSIQDEATKRISNFVERVFDDHYERKGHFAKGDEDQQ